MTRHDAKKKSLLLGWIPYWNLMPLKQEILSHKDFSVEMKLGPPRIVNQWLLQDEIDLAPCSSVCLSKYPDFQMAFPCGISATGSIKSVYWGFHSEQQELLDFIKKQILKLKNIFAEAQIKHKYNIQNFVRYVCRNACELPSFSTAMTPSFLLTKDSETSSSLTNVLMNLIVGEKMYQRMLLKQTMGESSKPIELLIGNKALLRRSEFFEILDLGSLWYELTRMPFVYAVWQTKRFFSSSWKNYVMKMASIAQKKISIDPLEYLPKDHFSSELELPIDFVGYWKCLRYCLSREDLKGLLLFLCFVRSFEEKEFDEEWIKKIYLWQEKYDL